MTLTTATRTYHPSPAQIEDSRIQLHSELTEIVRDELGMHEPYASAFAAAFQRGMEKKFGGGRGLPYIKAPDKTARNAAIRAEFDGTNHDAVCLKHGIKRTRLYEIVNQRE